MIIHADDVGGKPRGAKARVETFVVGQNVAGGETLQWIVEGGKYKASYLLPDDDQAEESKCNLLISEIVIPGFEFADHDFMKAGALSSLVSEEESKELVWLLRKSERPRELGF